MIGLTHKIRSAGLRCVHIFNMFVQRNFDKVENQPPTTNPRIFSGRNFTFSVLLLFLFVALGSEPPFQPPSCVTKARLFGLARSLLACRDLA